MAKDGGFQSYAEKIDARKVRERSDSFRDHFSQARLFFLSQSAPEQDHMVEALRFELGKVETPAIQERMLFMLSQVDKSLASRVAAGLGMPVPKSIEGPLNRGVPADADPKKYEPTPARKNVGTSPALSMAGTAKDSIKTRKIAFLAADGFGPDLAAMQKELDPCRRPGEDRGAPTWPAASSRGGGEELVVDFSLLTTASVLFDAVYVPGGAKSVAALKREAKALHFVNEAYMHCKAVAATGAGVDLLAASYLGALQAAGEKAGADAGVIADRNARVGSAAKAFVAAIAEHRHWSREAKDQVPA